MKIYLACYGMMAKAYPHIRDRFGDKDHCRVRELRSFAEQDMRWHKGHSIIRWSNDFMLDSGAFTAWSSAQKGKGKIITKEEYGDYLERYFHQVTTAMSLDAIPMGPTPPHRLEAALESLRNQLWIEKHSGACPVPVFHKGEPWEFLEFYVENYDYIALGGLVLDAKAGGNEDFFPDAWSRIVDAHGVPRCKVHAFGMTSLPSMLRYPWYSCDSSAWLVQSGFGNVYVPRRSRDGTRYDYDRRPRIVAMSDQSSNRQYHGWHWSTLDEHAKRACLEYFDEKGFVLRNLQAFADRRFEANLEYWVDLEDNCHWLDTWNNTQFGIFDSLSG